MRIYPIRAFKDNYIWVAVQGRETVIVDPGEAAGVLKYLKDEQLDLVAILLTHNHDDHIGGVGEIITKFPDTPVYGPEETKPLNDHNLTEGDAFKLFNQTVEVIETPGHTEGHISYLMGNVLFCGDALFSAGTGRVFTGDYEAQYESLQKFNQLKDTVNVYAAHEYTETNLRFAQTVEPNNKLISDALTEVKARLEDNQPTLPSTIGREKEINLLLQAETLEEFKRLRLARDDFS